MTRFVPRSAWHPANPVSNDGVTSRPFIGHFANGIAVHYTGSPRIARASTDTALAFMPSFQRTAINAKKSFEYNALIPPRMPGLEAEVWEYAGEFMGAHAGEGGKYERNNSTRYAIQFTIGVDNHPSYSNHDPLKPVRWEPLTDAMVDAFRWWVHQLRTNGVVAWDCPITPDRHLPGRATTCPGESVMARWSELVKPWVDTEPHPPIPPEDDMAKIAKIRFKGFADQFALIPLGPDTNRRLDIEAQAPIVVACVSEDDVEREVGYQLAPTANGQ